MKRLNAELQRALIGFLWGTAVGLLLIAALYLNLYPAARLRLNDPFYPSSGDPAPVAVVVVDEEAVHRYGRPETWPPERYRALLRSLRGAGARVVALTFPLPPGAEEALTDEDPGHLVLPVLGAGTPRTARGRLLYPYLLGPESGRFPTGHINLPPDPDGVLRRLPLWIGGPGRAVPALAWQAVARYLGADVPTPTDGPFGWEGRLLTPDPAGRLLFSPSAAPVPTFRIGELTGPAVPPNPLEGRIVFVGLEAAGEAGRLPTPAGAMDEAHIHAQAAAALMRGLTLTPLPAVTAVLTLIASVLAGWITARLRRPLPRAVWLLGLAGSLLLAFRLLYRARFQVDVLPPLLGLGVSGLLSALRLSHEERRRRQQLLRSLQGRLSPHLLASLRTHPDGERILAANIRFVAVLFADIRGFVRLTEGQDPRKIQETAGAHLAQFTQAILDSGGVVIKYVGDMVAAVFNAPVPIEQPVDQALCAALEGLRRLRELWARNPEMIRMPMGVGIHAGSAVVGLLGPKEQPEYDAIGDTVNVAARLSTYAPAGEIYVTEAVVATARRNWRFEPVGTLRLRGRYEPVIVYRLREPLAYAAGGERSAARIAS